MAEEGEISPVREDISPDPTHSLEEDDQMPSERRGRKRTPSPTRSKGKSPAKRRRKHFSSCASSSGSSSSNNSDSESVSNSDKSPVRIRSSKRPEKSASTNSTKSKSPPLALIDFDTSANNEEGVYTRFTAAGENIPRLCLTKDMTKYLQKQFSSYLRDKVLKEDGSASKPSSRRGLFSYSRNRQLSGRVIRFPWSILRPLRRLWSLTSPKSYL